MKSSADLGNDFAVAFLARVDAGSGPGYVEVYDGTQPATPDTAVTTQTLLGTLTLSDPAGSISGRTLTFGTVTEDSSADADGTATWCRMYDSDATPVADFSAGEAGSMPFGADPDMIMNNSDITSGAPIRILSFLINF
jgi:hypothetical protein